jgi:pimeloyl-ACP methyl ester carboxylesterase
VVEILRAEHRVEVGDGLTTAVTVIAAPARVAEADRPSVIFAFPGGGYGRRYFDLQLDGHGAGGSYSQGEHHAARGLIVVACDHLGCGESDGTPGLTLARIVSANAATVAEMRRRLADGKAAPGLAPIRDPLAIGIGQSMGGCFTIAAQSRHRCFDAVAILGYSAHHTVVPVPPGVAAGTFSLDVVRYAWHWDDVPAAIVDRDVTGYLEPQGDTPPPPWRSLTVPEIAVDLIEPGYVSADAAAIDVPVFVAAGERDVVPDLHAESTAYRRARDVTLYRQPRAAHMHNFAGTRALLWERLASWYATCAELAGLASRGYGAPVSTASRRGERSARPPHRNAAT